MRIAIDLFNFCRGNDSPIPAVHLQKGIRLQTIQGKLCPNGAKKASISQILRRIVLENLVVTTVQLIVREMGVTLRDGNAPMAGELLSQLQITSGSA